MKYAPSLPRLHDQRALALFLAERYSDAAAEYRLAAAEADGAEGIYFRVLEHLALRHAGTETNLMDNLESLDTSDWPRPVADYYLGEIGEGALLSAAAGVAQACDAKFYVAEGRLLSGDLRGAAELFTQVVEECPPGMVEYVIAGRQLTLLEDKAGVRDEEVQEGAFRRRIGTTGS
jgi:lipoprotein NlpI